MSRIWNGLTVFHFGLLFVLRGAPLGLQRQ
jgi:hypothetical protein